MKMMLVLSDTHGNTAAIARLKEVIGESDYVAHLGDYARDIEFVREQYPEKVISVAGNYDVFGVTERTMDIEGVKVLFTHGHRFGVKNGLERLFYFCSEKGIDVALYGHTHIASLEESEGVKLVNPGHLSRRGEGKSYAYLVFDSGKVFVRFIKISEKLF